MSDAYKLTEQSVGRLRRAVVRSETQPYDISGSSSANIASGTAVAWQRGVNGSGQTIPAYSCVAVGAVTATSDGYLASLTRPSSSVTQYGLTGANDCQPYGPSGPSLCSFHLEAGWAKYDTGSPNPGETWGPKSGQFTLTKDAPGFTVVSVVNASKKIMLVRPTNPFETRIVDINDGSSSAGTQISATSGCIWPGRIMGVSGGGENFCANPWTPTPTIGGVTQTEIDVWLTVIDMPGGSGTSGLQMTVGDRYIGRYLEDYTLSGTTKPLYAIRKGVGPLRRFELYTDLVFGTGSALAYPLKWTGSTWAADTSQPTFTVYDPFIAGGDDFSGKGPVGAAKGYQGWCQLQPDSGLNEIVYLEHKSLFVKGTLYQQLKSSDTSQANCTITDYWQGRNPDPSAANITVQNEGKFWGPTSAVFYAMWDDNDSQWNLMWVQHQARFAYVTLNADMSSGSSSGATVNSFWDGIDPGPTITVNDPKNFFSRALNAAKMLVTFNESTASGVGQYETVEGNSQAGEIVFKLSGALSSGSASASLLSSAGQAGGWGTQQDTQNPVGTITVYDPYGSTGLFQFCPANAMGTAIFDRFTGKYWIVACQQKARWLSGTISSLTSGVGNTTTMTVAVAHDGISPGSSVTVTDTDGAWGTISTSKKCKAYFNPDDGKYYLLWVQC